MQMNEGERMHTKELFDLSGRVAHTRDQYHHDSTQTINVEAQRENGKARRARFVETDADRTVQRDQNQRRDSTCEGRDDGWRGDPDTPFTQHAASDSDHDCG